MYDPKKHHRRSIRLKGYDYTQDGAYSITICVQGGDLLLAVPAVADMINSWWVKLPEKFPEVDTDAFVIMPNHIHGIILLSNPTAPLHSRQIPQGPPSAHSKRILKGHRVQKSEGATMLGDVVRWFKTMTTNAYLRGVKQKGWEPFAGKLWQRNYYEQIVRNERHLDAIRKYIEDNPANWEADELNPSRARNVFNMREPDPYEP